MNARSIGRRAWKAEYESLLFRNGYGPNVPEMEVEFKGVRKTVRKGDPVYAIKLGRILRIGRGKHRDK